MQETTTTRELPKGWRWVKLGEVCELNPRRSAIARNDDAPTTFVPMPAVAEAGGGIVRAEVKPFSSVRKGYTYFAEGDVLFAKITPCMQNGKHAVVRGTMGGFGFGSTEFHVIRPNREVIPEWIHCLVVQPQVLEDAQAHFTGAVGQQRVPADYLAGLELPLPSLPEQRRIAGVLREQLVAVAWARAALAAQLAAVDALPAALLRRAFAGEV